MATRALRTPFATGKRLKGAAVPFSDTFGAMVKTLAAAVRLPTAAIDQPPDPAKSFNLRWFEPFAAAPAASGLRLLS